MTNDPEKGDAEEVSWFIRTGHCGVCGQPGSYCLCRTSCVCAAYHPTGPGLGVDAVNSFSVPIVEQDSLFGAS